MSTKQTEFVVKTFPLVNFNSIASLVICAIYGKMLPILHNLLPEI